MAAAGRRAGGKDKLMRSAAALAACLLPALAAAQPLPTLHGVLSIEGKQVALPEGEWLRAGAAEEDGRAPGVVSEALLQVRGGEVIGSALVQVNKAGAASDWGNAPACARRDLPLARVRYTSDHDGSCAYVAVVADGVAAVDPAWAAARAAAAARGWAMPARWAEAGIRVSDPLAALQVRYGFPLSPGQPLPPGLVGWTDTAWDSAEHGLLNLLAPSQPLPSLGKGAPEPVAVEAQPAGGLPRAVWKTITFRMIATTIDFSTNVIAIGNLTTAVLLSAWNTVTGPWIYLAHEMAWDYFGAPAVRQLDLPGLGPEAAAGA